MVNNSKKEFMEAVFSKGNFNGLGQHILLEDHRSLCERLNLEPNDYKFENPLLPPPPAPVPDYRAVPPPLYPPPQVETPTFGEETLNLLEIYGQKGFSNIVQDEVEGQDEDGLVWWMQFKLEKGREDANEDEDASVWSKKGPVKFVESRSQDDGSDMKQFASDVMQDKGSPSSITSVKLPVTELPALEGENVSSFDEHVKRRAKKGEQCEDANISCKKVPKEKEDCWPSTTSVNQVLQNPLLPPPPAPVPDYRAVPPPLFPPPQKAAMVYPTLQTPSAPVPDYGAVPPPLYPPPQVETPTFGEETLNLLEIYGQKGFSNIVQDEVEGQDEDGLVWWRQFKLEKEGREDANEDEDASVWSKSPSSITSVKLPVTELPVLEGENVSSFDEHVKRRAKKGEQCEDGNISCKKVPKEKEDCWPNTTSVNQGLQKQDECATTGAVGFSK